MVNQVRVNAMLFTTKTIIIYIYSEFNLNPYQTVQLINEMHYRVDVSLLFVKLICGGLNIYRRIIVVL